MSYSCSDFVTDLCGLLGQLGVLDPRLLPDDLCEQYTAIASVLGELARNAALPAPRRRRGARYAPAMQGVFASALRRSGRAASTTTASPARRLASRRMTHS